jgi:aquaporin Z
MKSIISMDCRNETFNCVSSGVSRMEETEMEPESPVSANATEVKETAWKKYAAEFVGTFLLVFMGCGSAVFLGVTQTTIPSIAFAFGLTLLVMVYTIGSISGCHINPAVSISLLVRGKITPRDTVAYIIAQCIGAIVGAGVLFLVANGSPNFSLAANGLGQNGYAEASPAGYTLASALVAEVVLTFLLCLVIHGSTSEKVPKGFAGISIGLSLVLIHIVGIPITGTSVNPARSLGPAVIMGLVDTTALVQLWLFWVAPIIGAILAAELWKILDS